MRSLRHVRSAVTVIGWLVVATLCCSPLAEAGFVSLYAPARFSPQGAVYLVAYDGGYTLDKSRTDSLTQYLHTHRLPLVGAQVLNDAAGNRRIVLWGFVATPFGKKDAVTKSRRFLHDSSVQVDNRIVIRPELLASNRPSTRSAPPSSSYVPPSVGSLKSYEGQFAGNQQQYQQYQQQGSPDLLTALLPLLAITGAAVLGGVGGGYGSFGLPGTYGSYSPYGPYQPNPGAGYPYGSYP